MTESKQHGDDGWCLGQEAMQRLRYRAVCAIDSGLTEREFDKIEQQFGFRFADDHRAFLAAGLPVNTRPPSPERGLSMQPEPWPDWRNGSRKLLRNLLNRPTEGVLFDVTNNGFWYDGWGPRPNDLTKAQATAAAELARVPRMVPVYLHRCLPEGAGTYAHPVLSIWQTDIIFYGMNLADYIYREFGLRGPGELPWQPEARVEFWRDLVQ